MPFMVIYSTSDGSSCHEQADAIDEAALFVERLRNKEGIEEIRIYRMEEINFAFRPYYKVELGMPERLTAAPPPEVLGNATAAEAAPVEDPPAVQPERPAKATAAKAAAAKATETAEAPASMAEDDGVNGRRGLFGR
jgi:hypothetical protein